MKKVFLRLSMILLCGLLVFSITSCGKKYACVECGKKCSDKYQSTTGSLCKDCYKTFIGYIQ